MKTNRILIAILFPITFASCATDHSQDGLTPISRWALGLQARLHTPQWNAPSDSCQKIADHWDSIVRHDMIIAWHYAMRPDLIADSTVIQFTGEYVGSDSLPNVFERHIARLDTAENVAENYMINQRRLYSTNPEAIHNIPITEEAAASHRAEIEALRTALSLRVQVRAISDAEPNFFGYRFGARFPVPTGRNVSHRNAMRPQAAGVPTGRHVISARTCRPFGTHIHIFSSTGDLRHRLLTCRAFGTESKIFNKSFAAS